MKKTGMLIYLIVPPLQLTYYGEKRPPTEECDLIAESLPYPVRFALSVHFTKRAYEAEKDIMTGLEKAGFELDHGVDGAGIARAYMTRGGGYYIDVGCSQLIADGKIKVRRSPEGISGFTERGLKLKDGGELDADIVVLATGYDNMRTTVRKTLGDKVADRLRDVWDLDEEGELNAVSFFLFFFLSSSSGKSANGWYRCGDQADIQGSGIWEGILLCAGFTRSSWRCRLRLLRLVCYLNRQIDNNTRREYKMTFTMSCVFIEFY